MLNKFQFWRFSPAFVRLYGVIVYGVITIFVLWGYDFLPEKVVRIWPNSQTPKYIYSDPDDNGAPYVRWLDYDGLKLICDIPSDGRTHFCGFDVYIGGGQGSEGLDLTEFKTVLMDLDYVGPDTRLRFYMRNYLPGFSDIQDLQTAQFNNVNIPVKHLRDELLLNFSEFSVADWWTSGYRASRESSIPSFKHVVAFGVDLSYPAPAGEHILHLRKLEFVGSWIKRENWYLGILLFWLAVFMGGGAFKLARLSRQQHQDAQRLHALLTQNSELSASTAKYRQLSATDQLTGLLNRHGLIDFLEKNQLIDQTSGLALIITDLDYFKAINDVWGHDKGDLVLKHVAKRLAANLHKTDRIGRWGGEEFVIVLPSTSLKEAQAVAEQLRLLVAEQLFPGLSGVKVTLSLGVGQGAAEMTFDTLFQSVDEALYQAKAEGRNRVICAD